MKNETTIEGCRTNANRDATPNNVNDWLEFIRILEVSSSNLGSELTSFTAISRDFSQLPQAWPFSFIFSANIHHVIGCYII
jgi:hypothetical protein